MPTFQVGDKVVINKTGKYPLGDTGIVTDIYFDGMLEITLDTVKPNLKLKTYRMPDNVQHFTDQAKAGERDTKPPAA
jgi:hypothetical protein